MLAGTYDWDLFDEDYEPCENARGFLGYVAASRGHLNIVRWLRRMLPHCSLTWLHMAAGLAAAEAGHLHVVTWMVSRRSRYYEETKHELIFAALDISHLATFQYLEPQGYLQVFDALQYLEIARMGDLDLLELMAPIMRCNCDMLYVLKNMISASAGWVDGPLPLMPEKSRKKYWGIRRPSPRVLEVFDWLAGEMGGLSESDKVTLQCQASQCKSILTVQPAARYSYLDLPWDLITHSRAAAQGSLALLRWLLGLAHASATSTSQTDLASLPDQLPLPTDTTACLAPSGQPMDLRWGNGNAMAMGNDGATAAALGAWPWLEPACGLGGTRGSCFEPLVCLLWQRAMAVKAGGAQDVPWGPAGLPPQDDCLPSRDRF